MQRKALKKLNFMFAKVLEEDRKPPKVLKNELEAPVSQIKKKMCSTLSQKSFKIL